MAQFFAPIINEQQIDANGDPLSGGTIAVYLAGTSTPATTTSDKAGLVPNTWPIVLNTLGVNNQGAVWLTGGAAYKYIIKDADGATLRTIDNVSGINDTVVTNDQWIVFQGAPTFVSATSFTVVGDQTQTFQIRRRLKTQNTGGLIYSTITNSVYSSPNTTVTVQNDSGVLDSGLSQVSYGLISPLNSSMPSGLLIGITAFTASGTFTPAAGAKRWVVHGIGSGGAGGGCQALAAGQVSIGGGGSSGARGIAHITTGMTPTVTVTIGAAGPGSVGSNGGAGGASSFGAFLTLPGGNGGLLGTATAVSAASGGAAVSAGGTALITPSTGTTGAAAIASFASGYVQSGAGGSTEFGSGGQAIVTGGPTSGGAAGIGRGSGGSGAGGVASGAAAAGGSGAAGVFIVYEYA
jgi:hypothetical protein